MIMVLIFAYYYSKIKKNSHSSLKISFTFSELQLLPSVILHMTRFTHNLCNTITGR